MTATTIRDFLISLRYEANKSSEQTFKDSLKKTAENAVKLSIAIEAADAVIGSVVEMSQGRKQRPHHERLQI